ncbi:MAG: GGDEF domain-containing protein [Clostridia bacterium]|nr:GGDEF domain-containing protein [Clostridia bacterium]
MKEHSKDLQLSVLMMDIDDFKKINDTYGHVMGDTAILFTADALRIACKRMTHPILCARFGGDEFVVLFETSDPAAIDSLKENIERELEIRNAQADVPFKVHMCIGTSGFTGKEKTPDVLISLADEDLYGIKKRNHVGR